MNLVGILFILMIIMANENWTNPFAKENSIALKGVCTMFVIFRHLLAVFDNEGIVGILFKDGFLFVGIFFLFSGYGIAIKLDKESEKRRYLISRIIKIGIPILSSGVIFAVLQMNELRSFFSFSAFRGAMLLVPYSWYIVTIVLFYILYFFISFLKNNIAKVLACFTMLGGYVLIMASRNYNICWFMSCLPFGLGVIYALYEKKLLPWLEKYHIWITFFSIIAYHMFYSCYDYTDVRTCILQNFTTAFFCIIVLCITAKIHIVNNMTMFLGKISLELYLSQGIAVMLIDRWYEGKFEVLWCALAIGIDIICAICFKKINTFVIKQGMHK